MKQLSFSLLLLCFSFFVIAPRTIYAAPVASNFTTAEVCLGQVTNASLAPFVTGGVGPYTFQIVTSPIQGNITSFSATSGAFSYTQFSTFIGNSDSFTYKATDSTSTSSNTATVTINVGLLAIGTGTPPICSNTNVSSSIGGQVAGGTPPYVYNFTTAPAHGTLTLAPGFTANGNFTYTPNPGFAGTELLFFSVTDALGCVNNSRVFSGVNNPTVTIIVGSIAPSFSISGKCVGSTISSTLSGIVAGATNYTILTNPSQGTLTPAPNFSASGNFTYTSNVTFTGNTDSFTYQFTSSIGCVSTPGTVTLNVGVVAANLTTRITCPGGSLTTTLFNQASKGIPPYRYFIATNPSQGTLTLDPNFVNNGIFTYTAFSIFNGSQDTFTFYVMDTNNCTSNIATVTIPVGLKINNVTTNSVCVGTAVSGTLASAGNAPFTFNLISPPSFGALFFNTTNGNFTYSPSVLYSATSDSFSYSVTDTTGCVSNTAIITIPITINTATGITTPSVCNNNKLNSNLSQTISSTNTSYTFSLVRGPSNGCLTLDPNFAFNGVFTYIPNPSFTGISDSFVYELNYANGCSSTLATAIIPVGVSTPSYDTQMVCQGNSFTSFLNGPASGGIPPLTYTVTSGPSHGTVSYSAANGHYTYSTTGFTGPFDSFTYTITDSSGCVSNTITVTIPVGFQIANATIPATCPGVTINGNLSSFLSRGEAPFVYSLITPPTHGTFNLTGSTGAFTYSPTPGFTGPTDSFIFKVVDSNGCNSNNATITINLQ